jgi:glycosyltransferase involved in cell wall biosynthesis
MREPSLGPAPAVSIVLPTFNRVDVIGRALDSVRRQTFGDFELLVIDDGSTDGTAELVAGLGDPRIRVVRQANAGVYVARNLGLQESRGRWITFLDSDDAWAPQYLELTTAFLRHHPGAEFVTTEFWEDWGTGPAVKHDAYEIGTQYPAIARAIGSHRFDLPPGETDDYLRVYASRQKVGAWGAAAAAAAGAPDAHVYTGSIFAHMRFGYLNWLPITLLSRRALETIGPFSTHTRSAADYHFLGRLTRAFPANMIGIPLATKYDRAAGARSLKQDHLAKGAGAYRFEINKLGFFDELFGIPGRGDPEVEILRRHYSLDAARAALRLGMRVEAGRHLREAARLERRLWLGYPGLAYVKAVPSDRWVGAGFRGALRALDVGERLLSGKLTPVALALRLLRGARPSEM